MGKAERAHRLSSGGKRGVVRRGNRHRAGESELSSVVRSHLTSFLYSQNIVAKLTELIRHL